VIEASDNLFAWCAAPVLTVHALSDGGLRTLTQACRTVERMAADEGVADVVRPLLTKVKSMRFCLVASPVHGGDSDLRLSSVALRLASAEEQLAWSASPRLAAEFKKIRPLVVELSRRQTSPLQETFRQLWAERSKRSGRLAVVVPDFGVKARTDAWLRQGSLKDMPLVLTPSALRHADYYDELFIFGPPRWYVANSGEFIFATPRSRVSHLIGYRWSGLALTIEPVFRRAVSAVTPQGGAGGGIKVVVPPAEAAEAEEPSAEDTADTAEDFGFDVQSILQQRRQHGGAAGDPEDEEVDAKIVLLGGGEAVMLPWTDDAKTYSADFGDVGPQVEADEDDEDAGQVRRVFNQEFETGDFIILRTGSGGDLLPKVADGVMGTAAETHRLRQQEWKHALRDLERRHGSGAVCDRLRGNGANHASPSNLRNWIRARTIRPDSDEDFTAIFRTTGLEHRAAEFVASSLAINSAHRSAGFKIRKLLIAKVRKADLRKMRAVGKMEFRLEELSNDASMTAYRIERILPDVVHARLHELNDVFTLEAD
jgi:hypothetical protein